MQGRCELGGLSNSKVTKEEQRERGQMVMGENTGPNVVGHGEEIGLQSVCSASVG